jgi:hypothetical protein
MTFGSRGSLRPETTAYVGSDHIDRVGRDRECLGNHQPHDLAALVGVVQPEPLAIPHCRRRVRLHRVVVLGRSRIGHVDLDLAVGVCGVGITHDGVRLGARVDRLRGVEARVVGSQDHVMGFGGVVHLQTTGGFASSLRRARDHQRHDLAAVGDLSALQHLKRRVADILQPRRIAVPQHLDHPIAPYECIGVHRTDPPPSDPSLDDPRVGRLLYLVLEGVACPSGDLVDALDARQRQAEDTRSRGGCHHSSPPA